MVWLTHILRIYLKEQLLIKYEVIKNKAIFSLRSPLGFHYDEVNSFLFVNGVEIYKLKGKDSEINAAPLCLDNFLKDFSADNMKKTGLNRYVYDFSINYDSIDVAVMLDIHKYMIKNTT